MARNDSQNDKHLASVRETVESVWIAVVLAFVLRAFVLEAFVIPTGSMAPRLMGRHWQFDCPACGYHYAYGIQQPSRPPGTDGPPRPRRSPVRRDGRISGPPTVCPNCGHEHKFQADFPFGGDRVLVLKYLYRFREPKPWDVVVFKNPQDNEQNYIKRLIGLPGQIIEIIHGDVFVCDGIDLNNSDGVIDESDFDVNGDGKTDAGDLADPRFAKHYSWRILRKSPKTQEVMWQVIFDNDYQPGPAVYRSASGRAWQSPWRPGGGAAAWDLAGHGGRVFAFGGSAAPAALQFVADARRFCPVYAYNQPSPRGKERYDPRWDVNYDLKLSFMFVPRAENARIGLQVSSFEHQFRAWLGADGSCTLRRRTADEAGKVRWDRPEKDDQRWPSRNDLPPLEPNRAYQVALTHVDRCVTLWLDGKAVLTTTDVQYSAKREQVIEAFRDARRRHPEGLPAPTVAILGQGGKADLWHITLMRDVYYTRPFIGNDTGRPGRATAGNPMVLQKFNNKPDMDEFFVLGDNSPASLDSRLWDHCDPTLRPGYRKGTVPRYNMIGKAFFVYWPGGYRLPLLQRLPIVPNVGRMRLIR